MKLARVVGTVVSTINSPIFGDRTLLLCDLVEPSGEPAGGYLIAVDTVGAGAGELVLILDEGTSARQIVGEKHGPLRTVVVGIVDEVAGPASVAKAKAPIGGATVAKAKAPIGDSTVPKAPRRRAVGSTRPKGSASPG
jgi:ethanolamine utilization protein EutN